MGTSYGSYSLKKTGRQNRHADHLTLSEANRNEIFDNPRESGAIMREVSRLIMTSLCSVILLSVFAATSGASERVDHSLYADLLKKYVKDGVVDYQGFQQEEETLDRYLALLEQTDTNKLSRNEQFAFYINAYNAWTIKLILSGYPGIKSIWDLGSRILKWKSPFRKKIVRIEGGAISLDHLEHSIMRPRFKDPRTHFAVNCASKSCPTLIPEPYQGHILDQQLNASTRSFLNNPKRNRLEENTLYVSKIFKWFAEDFNKDVVGFFLVYLEGDTKEDLVARMEKIRVKYLDYDWSLNGE